MIFEERVHDDLPKNFALGEYFAFSRDGRYFVFLDPERTTLRVHTFEHHAT